MAHLGGSTPPKKRGHNGFCACLSLQAMMQWQSGYSQWGGQPQWGMPQQWNMQQMQPNVMQGHWGAQPQWGVQQPAHVQQMQPNMFQGCQDGYVICYMPVANAGGMGGVQQMTSGTPMMRSMPGQQAPIQDTSAGGMPFAVGQIGGQHKRLAKAGKRLQKLRSLKVPVTRKKVRVYSASIVAAGIWGHQSQGISPKVQKTLRMQAGNMVHLQKLGSVDIVLDLQESNIKDPAVEIVVQHWKTVSKVLAKGDDAQWICRTWQVLW